MRLRTWKTRMKETMAHRAKRKRQSKFKMIRRWQLEMRSHQRKVPGQLQQLSKERQSRKRLGPKPRARPNPKERAKQRQCPRKKRIHSLLHRRQGNRGWALDWYRTHHHLHQNRVLHRPTQAQVLRSACCSMRMRIR